MNLKGLVDEVNQCGKSLSKWNLDVYGNIGHMISKKEEELKNLLSAVKGVEDVDHIDRCKKELVELALREEVMWKQRSKNT